MDKHSLRRIGAILAEQQRIFESLETQTASNIWDQNKDNAAKYISTAVYSVRPIEDGSKFEVTIEKGSKRIPFATLTKQELDKSFAEMHPNQPADNAEGFVQYRDVDEIEAVKFDKDPVKLNTGDLLDRGDFLIRRVKGDDFVYEVMKSKDFDAAYSKK